MAYEAKQSVQIQIMYGHDDDCIIMQFSQMIQNNRMTIEQTREMITSLEGAIEKLFEHKGKKPN